MTGHNNGSGYRYTFESETSPGLIHEDNEVGALDAPRCVPAGCHTSPFYFDGSMYLVARRRDGKNANILSCEWRI